MVVVFGGALHLLNHRRSSLLPTIILLLGVGLILTNILSGRNLTFVGLSLDELNVSSSAYAGFLVKGLNWFIFGIALIGCIERVWVYANSGRPIVARPLWFWVLLFFSVSNGIVSIFFGSHPKFSLGVIYPAFVLALLSLDERWGVDELLSAARNTLLIILISGLILLPIYPSLVLEQNVMGFLPSVHFRYWGVASHANAIGPIAISFLLIRFLRPFSTSWHNYFSIFAALLTLLLSQSKTALFAGLIAYLTILIVELIQTFRDGKPLMEWRLVQVAKAMLMSISFLGAAIFLIVVDFSAVLSRFMVSDMGYKISTLSGRKKIWDVAVSEWHANPFFGYGPGLFDVEHRMRLGMNFAYHAHNQFLQTLAQSGYFGLAGLILLLLVFVWKSFAHSTATKGVSVAILMVTLIRCLTEVPLRSGNMFSGEFILLLTWGAILMANDSNVVRLNLLKKPVATAGVAIH